MLLQAIHYYEKGPTQNEEWRIVQSKNKEAGTMQW